MALVSMKRTAQEKKEEKTLLSTSEPDEFPWGLSVTIEDDELTKLGFKESPEVGVEMLLAAKVKVTSTSESKRDGSEEHRSISLQITDMGLTPAADRKSTEDVLFGDK
jgi:hypothetical protein